MRRQHKMQQSTYGNASSRTDEINLKFPVI